MSNFFERRKNISKLNFSNRNSVRRSRYIMGEYKIPQAEKGFQFS